MERTPALGLVVLPLAALLSAPRLGSATDLDRGHRILLERGLQLQALVLDYNAFDHSRWAESNFTTVNFWARPLPQFLGDPPGIPWGRWTNPHDGSDARDLLSSAELPFQSGLVSLQVGDEQDLTLAQSVDDVAALMAQHRTLYPDTITYTNQYGTQASVSTLLNYMSIAQPDMLSLDVYPFRGTVPGGSPARLYESMEKYRELGLAGNDGAGATPIPTALYIQTFYGQSNWDRPVSESEITLNQFAAWAFGFKMTNAFIYDVYPGTDFIPMMFNTPGDADPTAFFYRVADINAQSRRLGPALTRLVSTVVFMETGQYKFFSWIVDNAQPQGVPDWSAAADPSCITAVAAENLDPNVNAGLPGDVIIGYFKPLREAFDGPAANGEMYFMVVNGLSDRLHPPEETQQRIRLEFDFQATGINSLQRLNKDSGQVEVVPLVHLGGSHYRVDLVLGGGEGDLFKFNTGAPFIGIDNGGMTVEANGPYVFDAANPAVPLSSAGTFGSFGDADLRPEWSIDGAVVSTESDPVLEIADTGLKMTTGSSRVRLTVRDANFYVETDTAAISYTNTAPVARHGAFIQIGGAMELSGDIDDADLAVNGPVPGFERVDWEFSLTDKFGRGFLTGVRGIAGGASVSGRIDPLAVYGGTGDFVTRLNVRDRSGAVHSHPFLVTVAPIVPAPDFDRDGDVDQEDFGHMQACLTGFLGAISSGCGNADFDDDGYVTEDDRAVFDDCRSGAGIPVDPDCAD